MRKPLEALIAAALEEDIGQGDLTTEAIVAPGARCEAQLIAKQAGVLSGIDIFLLTFSLLDDGIEDWNARLDGEEFEKGDLLASFTANTRAVLMAERTAMNFTQHLSGIATLTARFMAQLEGLPCRVSDTRKTTPLLRGLEKNAVAHGGGANHRFNLASGILIKENHITAAGGVAAAVQRARAKTPHLMRVEVEVRNLTEFDEALAAGAEIIMLDNMGLEDMAEAVRRRANTPVIIEASGNATLDRIRAMAETGVDLISVGALTHSAPAVDMSLLLNNAG